MEPISEEYFSYKDDVIKALDFEEFNESSQYIHSSLILYKHLDFKGKIPSNNNLSESIGWCASKYEKRAMLKS